MKYEIRILHSAEKEMDKLPTVVHSRISNRILSLENNPRLGGAKKPSILYTASDSESAVTIIAVGHRRETYL